MDSFSLYIHVPFCRAPRCPYCDFFAVPLEEDLLECYMEALRRELAEASRGQFPAGARVVSMFFGGGTPSLLPPAMIGDVISLAGQLWTVDPRAEITVECNPEDVSPGWAGQCRERGVNRLSIGCQSFDRRCLQALGRSHEAEHNTRAVEAARAAGFESISADLIFGGPGCETGGFLGSLSSLVKLGVGHVSLYGYHLEQGALGFGRPGFAPAGDEAYREQYLAACDLLERHGWLHYEISNWAREESGVSRHNMAYWNRRPYLGAGPAAHSFVPPSLRMWNPANLDLYLEQGRDAGGRERESLDTGQVLSERIMLGLRLGSGVRPGLVRELVGGECEGIIDPLMEGGLLRQTPEGRLACTRRGWLVYDTVAARLITPGRGLRP